MRKRMLTHQSSMYWRALPWPSSVHDYQHEQSNGGCRSWTKVTVGQWTRFSRPVAKWRIGSWVNIGAQCQFIMEGVIWVKVDDRAYRVWRHHSSRGTLCARCHDCLHFDITGASWIGSSRQHRSLQRCGRSRSGSSGSRSGQNRGDDGGSGSDCLGMVKE